MTTLTVYEDGRHESIPKETSGGQIITFVQCMNKYIKGDTCEHRNTAQLSLHIE